MSPQQAENEKTTEFYDAVVIGAGAAGLLAAARGAERGRRTLLLEKNRKAGVKILISGGTRCNLTHDGDARDILAAFGSAAPFLHSALAALGPRELVELFHAEGLPTKVEAPTGKVFPQSDRALDVVAALLRRLERSGAALALGEAVEQCARSATDGPGNFRVTTSRRIIACESLLIAAGGRSYPGCGTTGDGYAWLAALGHTIRPPRPALVPLVSDETWVRELAGVTIADVRLSVVEKEGPPRPAKRRRPGDLPPGVCIERRGSLLFTHFGLSGPVVLDISRALTGAGHLAERRLLADFLPTLTFEEVVTRLKEQCSRDGRRQISSLAIEPVPKRLWESVVERAEIPAAKRSAEISQAELAKITRGLKEMPIRIAGHRGFEKAEVTAGGVELAEVDSRTMESKLVPRLYLAGEILDLDGFIGGYNFQAAFSTGWLAGERL